MADSGIQTMEDTGEYLFDTAHHVLFIQFWIDTTTSQVDELSQTHPPRTLHAGFIALASGEEGVPSDELTNQQCTVTWFSYFDFAANLKVEPSGFDYDDRIMWALPVGVISKFIAYW